MAAAVLHAVIYVIYFDVWWIVIFSHARISVLTRGRLFHSVTAPPYCNLSYLRVRDPRGLEVLSTLCGHFISRRFSLPKRFGDLLGEFFHTPVLGKAVTLMADNLCKPAVRRGKGVAQILVALLCSSCCPSANQRNNSQETERIDDIFLSRVNLESIIEGDRGCCYTALQRRIFYLLISYFHTWSDVT